MIVVAPRKEKGKDDFIKKQIANFDCLFVKQSCVFKVARGR